MIKIHTLRTEYRICPQGMDVAQPRFFWKLDAGSARNVTQQTCRVWVETASGRPVWDTGYILSSQLSAVYAGPALEPLTAYRWRVSVRVAPSQEEAVSDWAAFSTGKLGQPWQGAWISAEESVSPWAGVLVRRVKSMRSVNIFFPSAARWLPPSLWPALRAGMCLISTAAGWGRAILPPAGRWTPSGFPTKAMM